QTTVTPPGKSREQAAATAIASAVLPTPPGPSRVVTGAEVTLSLTSRISLSLPTSCRGRKPAGPEFSASARACSDMLTRHYRPREDALAIVSCGQPSDGRHTAGRSRRGSGRGARDKIVHASAPG